MNYIDKENLLSIIYESIQVSSIRKNSGNFYLKNIKAITLFVMISVFTLIYYYYVHKSLLSLSLSYIIIAMFIVITLWCDELAMDKQLNSCKYYKSSFLTSDSKILHDKSLLFMIRTEEEEKRLNKCAIFFDKTFIDEFEKMHNFEEKLTFYEYIRNHKIIVLLTTLTLTSFSILLGKATLKDVAMVIIVLLSLLFISYYLLNIVEFLKKNSSTHIKTKIFFMRKYFLVKTS